MKASIDIAPLTAKPSHVEALAELLIEAVANGGSVSFMHPLTLETAADFWTRSLADADAGRRVVLGAYVDGEIAGTVTLDLDTAQNQPHRAAIAKLMTAVRWRGHGVAVALMAEAERRAALLGRTLLTLDTAEDGGAAGLYERLGYQFAGVIPDYAYKPQGGLSGARIYFKRIGAASGASQASR